jgi:hypothetical protein
MKKLLMLAFMCMSFHLHSQLCTTAVATDYIETYNWLGDWWTPAATTGYFNNASVSPTLSAVIFGSGNGTSANEQDWYSLPNRPGLNPLATHKLTFRLGSYRFSNTSATTRGVDNPDFVEVQLSTNGGISYVSEMRIRGNANAYWNYNTAATASKTANGVITTFAPAAGGDRTATGDGYSVIELTIPPGPTQIAIDIFCRVNSAGEEWWIDNIMLEAIEDCISLPITLIDFDAKEENGTAKIFWSTASEYNTSHYIIERSSDGYTWNTINTQPAAGNSSQVIHYHTYDMNPSYGVNYYRLTQYDNDGANETFDIVALEIDNPRTECDYKFFDTQGKEVSDINLAPAGIYIRKCKDNYVRIYKQ